MGPENLENISNFEGWGLTLVAYIKKDIVNLTFFRITENATALFIKFITDETKHIKINAGKESWHSHNGVLVEFARHSFICRKLREYGTK